MQVGHAGKLGFSEYTIYLQRIIVEYSLSCLYEGSIIDGIMYFNILKFKLGQVNPSKYLSYSVIINLANIPNYHLI